MEVETRVETRVEIRSTKGIFNIGDDRRRRIDGQRGPPFWMDEGKGLSGVSLTSSLG